MSNRGRGRGVWGRISQAEPRPGPDRANGSARIQQRNGGPDRTHAKITENRNAGAEIANGKNTENRGARHNNFHDYWDDKPIDGRDVLVELMEKLNIDKADASSGHIIKKITKTVYDLCTSADALEDMVNKLHDKSLEDADFGRKAACVLGSVSQMEVGGFKLRDVLLRAIQADFKKRDQMRAKHPQVLYNAVRLLCEVFKEVKLGDGSVISVLCVPIIEYFHILLDISSPAAIQLVGQQLAQLGQELQVAQQDRVVKLMMKVRRGLVEDNKGEGEKSVLLRLLELYLLRWPVLLPEKVDEWYVSHREAFDCLVVVMDRETATPIYSEKDWMGGGEGRNAVVEAKDDCLETEQAITCMLREARISTEKDEVDNGKKNKKVVVGRGLWGRALQDLEAADKAEKKMEDKLEQGGERKREDREGSVEGKPRLVGRIIRTGSLGGGTVGRTGSLGGGTVGRTGSLGGGTVGRNATEPNDERREYASKWHDDRTNGHDYRSNGHDDRSNSLVNKANGHDYRSNGHDNRANGHDYITKSHDKTSGRDVLFNGQKAKENDHTNTMGKGVKDRLGTVENVDKNSRLEMEKKGENKENLDGDLRGRLNRRKTSPAGLIINVSNEDSRRNVKDASPHRSPRNVSLSPPTPDWKSEPPLEGNWADDLDSWE